METFKLKVRDFSVNFAKKSSNNIKSEIQNWEKKIDEIETLPSEKINMKEKRDLEELSYTQWLAQITVLFKSGDRKSLKETIDL